MKFRGYILLVASLTALLLSYGCQKKNIIANKRTVDKLYFLSNRDAQKREFGVFSMNRDGSHPINLTRNISGVRSFSKPCISHDGKTLVFLVFQPPKRFIYAMQVNDSSVFRLTNLNHDKPEISFSPDDKYILFVDIVHGKKQIFRMNRDGGDRRNLSRNEFDNTEPTFSPDGLKICFTIKKGKKKSIAIMNIDGSNQEVLTDDQGNDFNPKFSPDGKKIIFSSDRRGISDIYILQISDKKMDALFVSKSYNIEPQFSPDGKFVLFISNMRGIKYRDLILLDLSTKKVTNLTESLNHFNQNPVFLPDGKAVLFESIRFKDSDIFLVNIKNGSLRNLTNHPKWDLAPAW